MKARRISLLILLAAMLLALAGCGSDAASGGEATKLNFSDSASSLTALDGKPVTLTGYMATLSPLDGSYIYLMNMPYQSCPFCIPNTTQLANTMAVYAKSGSKFDFTDRPVKIAGTLEIGDYTDAYGYQYGFRIKDATYEVVDLSSVSSDYALYQSLAEDGVIADIYAMFDYLHFVSQWPEYTGSVTLEDGSRITYNLYAGDALQYLEDTGPYGFATQTSEDYFPTLISRVQAISSDGLTALVDVLKAAQEAEQYAREQLDSGNYTYDEESDKFTMIENDQLIQNYQDVYLRFDEWLATYQL